jgi:ferredoxin
MRPDHTLRVLVLAGILMLAAAATANAATLPLPSVEAEYKAAKDGKHSALLVETIRIKYSGTPQVSCNRCNRIKGKIQKSMPRKGIKVFRNVNWLIRKGRGIELRVTKGRNIGRFVSLRRKGSKLVYSGSGCLRGKRKIRCPRGTPAITPGTAVVNIDSDDDGLVDAIDKCPTVAGTPVNSGCPGSPGSPTTPPSTTPNPTPTVTVTPAPDGDKDGIEDAKDACPTQAGPVGTGGCPDGDADGIKDASDACPTQAGPAATGGCPDGDSDGTKDASDACPTQAGPANTGGCPDADSDGIKDSSDACPTQAGPASTAGCPDADGDGIKDSSDACPTQAGGAGTGGCPDNDGDGKPNGSDVCPDQNGGGTASGCPLAAAPVCADFAKNLKRATGSFNGRHVYSLSPNHGDVGTYEVTQITFGAADYNFSYDSNTGVYDITIPGNNAGGTHLYINWRAYTTNAAGERSYCAGATYTITVTT